MSAGGVIGKICVIAHIDFGCDNQSKNLIKALINCWKCIFWMEGWMDIWTDRQMDRYMDR